MDTHPGFPLRPMLRPGVRICRRADGELQVGLAVDLAVVVPDTDDVCSLLEGLRHGVPPAPPSVLSPAARRLCRDLLAHHLVVDGDLWLSHLGATDEDQDGGADTEPAEFWTALVAEAGTDARMVLERRRSARVSVHATGLPRAAARSRELLAHAGITVLQEHTHAPVDLAVLLVGGELDRARSDLLVRDDQPHLLLTVSEGRVRLGPLVVPGLTACLRCLDATVGERDPRHALVLAQYAEGGASPLPAPVPLDLLDAATGLLVRDVSRWVDGLRPATWSSTVEIDPELQLRRRTWRQHPGCGCDWAGQAVG